MIWEYLGKIIYEDSNFIIKIIGHNKENYILQIIKK